MSLSLQVAHLFLLAIPIACIAWTVTHEEIFKEPRNYCKIKSKSSRNILVCKFFYLFTCEYCFSHYITIFILLITGYKLIYTDWRGILIGGFSLVWIANLYMSLFGLLRQDLKKEKIVADIKEKELKEKELKEKELEEKELKEKELKEKELKEKELKEKELKEKELKEKELKEKELKEKELEEKELKEKELKE